MNDSPRTVICGASIYMLAIETGLSKMAEGDIVRINPYQPDIVKRISQLEPHVVIMEWNEENSALAREITAQCIPLIALDEARHSISILPGEHQPTTEINKLTSVIEKINREQLERDSGHAY
jgi:hypothetical protein